MKKLMIAAAIVCAAAMSQGAGVIWMTQGGFSPLASCTGSMDENCITAYLWSFAAADWNSSYETSQGVYDAYKAGTLTAATAQEAMWQEGNAAWMLDRTAAGAAYKDDGTQYYAAVLFLHSDTAGGDPDYYMGNWGTELAVDGDYGFSVELGTVQGGTSSLQSGGDATVWTQTVPEPTSGLLLLLGVAGLALKRRRA